VVKYKKQKGCRRQMILDNGDRLISSRHYREEFDRMIEERHESRILEKDSDNLSHEK
ncbi:LytTR family transcriptional regulator, partial [Coprobacillus cateniformis]|nr:LytTR family transcriptional regulator [Coprobacillus cateniformis]